MLCPRCGNELPRRAATCPNCGQDPDFRRELTQPGPQFAGFMRGALRGKSGNWVVRVGRALFIVMFLIPLLLFLFDRLR